MQGFLVTTASLVCMAYALPQDYTYTPKASETYVYDPNAPAAYSYTYDQSKDTPAQDQQYVFNYDNSKNKYAYKYDASKDSYKYAYDSAKDQYKFDAASNGQEFNLDSLTELTESLNLITSSKLFTDTLGGSKCPLLTELPEAIAEANNVVKARSGELNSAFRGLQATGRSGISQSGATVRQLGSVIGAIEPIVPVITNLFTLDASCGGEAAKEYRKKRQASSMCENPSELSRDVFLGLADLMDLTVELSASNTGRAANELNTNDIKEQANLIRDGADLLEEIDLTPLFGAFTFNTDCPTNLGELKSSIDDLADLVDILAPAEEEAQTRVVASPVRAVPATRFVQPYRQPSYVQRPGYAVVPQVYYG